MEPIVPSSRFEVGLCIEHHNAIVQAGIGQLSSALCEKVKVQRNWFTVHNTTPEDVDLPDLVIEFLSGIDIVLFSEEFSFLPHLRRIPTPKDMRNGYDDLYLGQYSNCIILYQSHRTDGFGLVMDLNELTCCYIEDCYDDPSEQRTWVPLHAVLHGYRNCIKAGKFYIFSEVIDGQEPSTPIWRLRPWTQDDIERTLQAWSTLVKAVASRMPKKLQVSDTDQEEVGLISPAVLDRYPAIPTFVREFLLRAARPPFEFIGPQLRVPDDAFIDTIGPIFQWSRDADEEMKDGLVVDSFLLFPFATKGVVFSNPTEEKTWLKKHLLDERGGLYIMPNPTFADSAKLLLPYSLGGNGHVKAGDGTFIKQEGNTVLYRHGHCPYFTDHRPQLVVILMNWWEKIQNFDWDVGELGVEGGIDLWKQADTQEHAEDYRVDFICI